MNKVDIYINDFRLDIFDDEEISINLSVQNVQDISKVFTDFTQGFTIPASPRNNEILQHYYNANITESLITTEVGGSPVWNSIGITWNSWNTTWNAGATTTSTVNTFDGRLRQEARIEINSLPFRTGVIEVENVQLKGTEPYAYTLTFYGDVVTLTDLFGEDYLYDVDFAEFNHQYTDTAIFNKLTTDDDTGLFYPLMSPVKNWIYNSQNSNHADNNIHFHNVNEEHGIHYYELKPALKVTNILTAIGAKYGITFTGAFLSATPFVDLSLWLHRFEGYLFSGGNDIQWQLINMNRNTGSGTQFNLTTDTWTVVSTKSFTLNITMANVNTNYELGIFRNGIQESTALVNAHPSTSVTTSIEARYTTGTEVQLYIRPQSSTSFNYQCTNYEAIDSISSVEQFEVDQTASVSYSFLVVVSDLMPEIKVKEFLAGILKMYNMVIVPTTSTNFLLQPLEDWYAAGTDQNYQTYLDITEYAVNRPPLYREIEFKYQATQAIIGFQYLQTNNIGFGDLNNTFTFDGEQFLIEVPFECPLFERLTDQHTSTLTNVLVYKSITSEANEDGTFNPYLGAPILFYGYFDNYDFGETNPVAFVNSNNTTSREVTVAWYANTSNRYSSAAASNTITFGADVDPYHLQSVNQSLYNNEWNNYITDLYAKARRVYNVEAVLPIGKIITLNLQNAIIWNNTKYIINNVSLNMTTGKATFELLNVV
jgi:hypothetical protein